MTVSTASSPTFWAILAVPAANSFAVREVAGSAPRRDRMTALSRSRTALSISAMRALLAHRDAGLAHVRLGLADGDLAEMEDRGGEQIGRASGRERVCQYVYMTVGGGRVKKKKKRE